MNSEQLYLKDLLMEVYEMTEEEAVYAIEEINKRHIDLIDEEVK